MMAETMMKKKTKKMKKTPMQSTTMITMKTTGRRTKPMKNTTRKSMMIKLLTLMKKVGSMLMKKPSMLLMNNWPKRMKNSQQY